jgi:hypothetical protein
MKAALWLNFGRVAQPLRRVFFVGVRAGSPAFEAILIFRVAHLSRRLTGGVFDFDSLMQTLCQHLRREQQPDGVHL